MWPRSERRRAGEKLESGVGIVSFSVLRKGEMGRIGLLCRLLGEDFIQLRVVNRS